MFSCKLVAQYLIVPRSDLNSVFPTWKYFFKWLTVPYQKSEVCNTPQILEGRKIAKLSYAFWQPIFRIVKTMKSSSMYWKTSQSADNAWNKKSNCLLVFPWTIPGSSSLLFSCLSDMFSHRFLQTVLRDQAPAIYLAAINCRQHSLFTTEL